jgi:hypothetical protein
MMGEKIWEKKGQKKMGKHEQKWGNEGGSDGKNE